MPFKPDNHWRQDGMAAETGPENPYDNATSGMNDLNGPHQSIEDNLAHDMNINPNVASSFEKPPIKRRKSMLSRHKDIEKVKNQIHELFAKKEKEQLEMNNDINQTATKRVDRHGSQTEVKQLYSTDGSHLIDDGKNKETVYTRIQEGNNNLMFVCEPKTMTSCSKQVGNNNVMVNLHMSMITNSCQILHEDTGKVFQLDSEGEVWLEIKLRRNKASERLSTCSNFSSDSNTSYPTSKSNVPSNIPKCHSPPPRTPTEHSESPPGGCPSSLYRGELSHHFNNLSGAMPGILDPTASNNRRSGHVIGEYYRSRHTTDDNLRPSLVTDERKQSDGVHQSRDWNSDWNSHVIDERHRSVEEGEFSMECNEMVADNIVVYENEDSIFVQMETPERLSDYANLEECMSVKEVLGRQKVKEFLESKNNNADFDVSIIGWEYEKEPLYCLPEAPYDNAVVDVDMDQPTYDEPINREPTRGPTRGPTLPPKPHRCPVENTVDISSALQVPPCWDGAASNNNNSGAGNRASNTSSIADNPSSGCGSNSNRSSSSSWSSNRTSAGSSSGYRTSGDASDIGTVGEAMAAPGSQLNIVYERTTSGSETRPPVPPKPSESGSRPPRPALVIHTLSYEEPNEKFSPKSRSPAREFPTPPVPSPRMQGPSSITPTPEGPVDWRPHSSEWYHGGISNETSKNLLTGMASGSFLVRDSSDSSGDHKFTLEFVDTDVVRRLKIIKTGDMYHLKESGMSFARVEDLIDEAMRTGIEVRSDRNSSQWRMIQIVPVKRRT